MEMDLTSLLADPDVVEPADDSREMIVLLTGYLSYRALRGRRDELQLTLRPEEIERLAELERVFAPPSGDDPHRVYLPRLHERQPMDLPVSFRGPDDEVRDARLRNVSLKGFFVETAEPQPLGEQVVLRFHDEEAGMDWHFAGKVRRVRGGPGGGMGLSFVGVPVEVHHRRPLSPNDPFGPIRPFGRGGGVPFAA